VDPLKVAQLLATLRDQRMKLDGIIAGLEQLAATLAQAKSFRRPGRKSMDAAARKEVYERMKEYWASRRPAEITPNEATVVSPPGSSGEDRG